MPTLNWIGKEAVEKHHKEVPFRLLEPDAALSCGPNDGTDSGNLIVQGDNLHALKALLPRYAGQVKCIYIDPPYNTGNEGWAYNDNVNSPEIRKWLGETVGKEGETLDRHDRWLCMMYPRLVLLKQFLREDGVIFVSIDDNEQATLRLLMDEIFGESNFLASIAWEKRYTRSNNAKLFYSLKDHVICYRQSAALATLKEPRNEKSDGNYANPDNDPRGPWMTSSYVNPAIKEKRPNLVYSLVNPFTEAEVTHPTHAWKYAKEEHLRHVSERRLWWGKNGEAKFPRLKLFLNEQSKGLVPVDIWSHQETGTTDDGGNEIKNIFGSAVFDTPKPSSLLQRIIRLVCNKDSIVLDSFAGSGTTAHAVLKQNAEDGGTRRFILVEMDAHIAPNVTAERVRRVAQGYTNAKGEAVPGLGGGFQFCRLSAEPLFDAEGQIREDVTFTELAKFVWFSETQTGYTGRADSPLLGVHEGRAIYLLYNGILKDKSVGGGNVLTGPVLAVLPPFDGPKTIYAAANRLGARAEREGISFKQTPYSLEV
ncbi:MAG: site-specific DNA-methyltransferase [Uliginosibacterium sp.]|nr:site-specific DNA-methyltransferase [Uliginosibacterium sp.]